MIHMNKIANGLTLLILGLVLAGTGSLLSAAPPVPDSIFPYTTPLLSTGTNYVLLLLIEFPDQKHVTDNTTIDEAFFRNGTTGKYPYESLRNFYLRSSSGQLNITGTHLGWYTTKQNMVNYGGKDGAKAAIVEALDNLSAGINPALYDNNQDGVLDYIIVLFAGSWDVLTDAKGDVFKGDSYQVGGLSVGAFTRLSELDSSSSIKLMQRVIHETGYVLGLPDVDARGMDMMDNGGACKGDFNCFSKFLLGWATPTVINAADGVHTITLFPSGGDCVMIMPGADAKTNPYAEYFMVENRSQYGNDADVPANGLVVWHVDATLSSSDNTSFAASDPKNPTPLLALMAADGSTAGNVNGATFYRFGKSFGPNTIPSSTTYTDTESGVTVDNITSTGGLSQRANYYIDDFGGVTKYSMTVQFIDEHRYGTVTPMHGLYNANDVVTLVATPVPGYQVSAWLGTDDDTLTTNTNTVTMTKSKTVRVSFEPALGVFYSITASVVGGAGGHGKLWPLNLTYLAGTKVVLSCEPDPGYRVKAWTGTDDDTLTSTTNTVTMTGDKAITVEFELMPAATFALSTSVVGGHGQISTPSGFYAAGAKIALTAVPDPGYAVKDWSGTDNDTLAATANTVTLYRNTVVRVEFVAVGGGSNPPATTGNTTTGTGGTSTGNTTGGTITLTVTPAPANPSQTQTVNSRDDLATNALAATAQDTGASNKATDSGAPSAAFGSCNQAGIPLVLMAFMGALLLMRVKE